MNWYKFFTYDIYSISNAYDAIVEMIDKEENPHQLIQDMISSFNMEQNEFHDEKLFTHLVSTMRIGYVYSQDPIFSVACLFHDIGKVRTKSFNRIKNDWTFYKHEYIGAKIFLDFARANNWPSSYSGRIYSAIRHHQYRIYDDTRDATIKKWLKSIGRTTWEDIRLLRVCDRMANEANKDKPIIYKKYIEVDNRVNELASIVF